MDEVFGDKGMNGLKTRVDVFLHYKDLLNQLVEKDIKLKYRRSFLGYLWSILNPLMLMVIMVIVFSNMFRFSIENYPVYLIIRQTCFTFLTESTNQAIGSITGNAALLKKTYVPKYIFTFAKVTSSCVNLIFSLGAMIIVFIVCRVSLHWTFLFIPVVLLQLYGFCLGIGLFLAATNVFFRDIQYIYSAVTTAWMYLTPIFYPLSELPENLQWIIKHLNPMYFYVDQFRDVVLNNHIPGFSLLGAGVIAAVIAMVLGSFVFIKSKDNFILYI